MIFHLYLSACAAIACVAILCVLKFISISKMRLDKQKKKAKLTTTEVLTLLKNYKPFPVSVHKGWKLHSFQNNKRIWTQALSQSGEEEGIRIYAAFVKVRVPTQVIFNILKDVSKTSSWKPGCLATSITYKPPEPEPVLKTKSTIVHRSVQHDIVMEETSVNKPEPTGIWYHVLNLFGQNTTIQSVTKEHKRYWHREDNGVSWLLQMCEKRQEWLFYLAQPVEEVDECLLTICGYYDCDNHHSSASCISEVIGALEDYIVYRKLPSTPLMDIRLPVHRPEKTETSLSSSDENISQSPGKRMFLRFRSLVARPTYHSEKMYSPKKQILRSASILHHHSTPTNTNPPSPQLSVRQNLKTNSLDRKKNMPDLKKQFSEPAVVSGRTDMNGDVSSNNNINKMKDRLDLTDSVNTRKDSSISTDSDMSNVDVENKDMDKILDEDIDDHEREEESVQQLFNSTESKDDIQHIVTANHAAAQLLAVALQASNIDLNQSVEEQVLNSGGWILVRHSVYRLSCLSTLMLNRFCGLDNDVVVLKKISVKQNIQCYLGKGIIQASPKAVWNAIKNPRTRFTYDDSLKKVDVVENVSDTIKIVYYYHEVLQLFKSECCDMVVTQGERIDNGDKYILAMQSTDKVTVKSPPEATRVQILPSGWIIEPLTRDKKVVSMVTYIMQIDFGNVKIGVDQSPFEDLIAKQPMSIAYLRQYLRPTTFQRK